jgi:hypothetical protein
MGRTAMRIQSEFSEFRISHAQLLAKRNLGAQRQSPNLAACSQSPQNTPLPTPKMIHHSEGACTRVAMFQDSKIRDRRLLTSTVRVGTIRSDF